MMFFIYYIIILDTPNEVLQKHSDKLTAAIVPCLQKLAIALHSKNMITSEQMSAIETPGIPMFSRAFNLVGNIQRSLQVSLHPDQYLIEFCKLLKSHGDNVLIEIATSMLQELGKYTYDINFVMKFYFLVVSSLRCV